MLELTGPTQRSRPTSMASSPCSVLCALLLLPLLSTIPAALSAPRCNAADERALLHLKKALGDPYTIITWTSAADCCSDWYGAKCDSRTGRVTSVSISNSEAAGPLPPVVGDLPYLDTLIVRKNRNVTGPLPPELSKLTNLKMMWMDWNSLTGPVPAFLGRMAKLEYINLSFNKLSGTIPPSLGDLPKLQALFLDRNRLAGAIPEALGRLRQANLNIRLSHNNLTGAIPQSFKRLKFYEMDLSRNRLTGDPSPLFGTATRVSYLVISIDLSRNLFEFDLSKAEFAANLATLDMNHNRLYGTIPAQLAKLAGLHLNVSYNRLCGKIPQGRWVSGLTMYEFFHNRFSDPLCHPDDKRSLLQLKKALGDPYTIFTWSVAADCCSDWADVTCDAHTGRVVSVDISNSEAAGPLPEVIGDLPYLSQLTIRESPNVTGPLPPALAKLANLRMLWMDRNSLTGPIPAFLGRLVKLEYINLSFNKLSGAVPPAVGDLPRLVALILEMNQLTGTIPESLGRLRNPVGIDIRLSGNRLTGPVPPSFGNLNISQIDLSRNQLTGDPSVLFHTGGWTSSLLIFVDLSWNQFVFDLSKAKFSANLGKLDLSHNRVYGKIPPEVAMLDGLMHFNVSYNSLCGKIPRGGGLKRLTKYEFFHNKCLCGTPLAPCK
ncbi:hypothetical protein Taro_012427 [Colocasia esculenta]|uniref:Leucine-rich repeat-containing N-terminal plant-type domain-containing protein n=1 Tax=Colocasia esculenta TaxID=4460 RepID=A0A843UFK6_COLES|nr:hypothetical protein [Colocasia esculenta]